MRNEFITARSAVMNSFWYSYLFQLHHALSGDLDDDLDSISYPYNKSKYDLQESRMKKRGSNFPTTIEQVDDIIDHSIEIESNKRMRNANVNAWTLRFIDKEMEYQVS